MRLKIVFPVFIISLMRLTRLNKQTAFADTVHNFKIPKHYFTELIEGVGMDITKKRYSTFMELDTYCYKVASVVGLMMSEIFGYSNKAALPYAVYLGKAMQLTNILRDVHEDYHGANLPAAG
jgi:phytoene synthase